MWTRHEKKIKKSLNFSHKRQFCGFIFKFVWAVYGGDVIGFCQYFRKVILKKNDQQQTKSKNLKMFTQSITYLGIIRIMRSFDSSAPELSSEYRVGGL